MKQMFFRQTWIFGIMLLIANITFSQSPYNIASVPESLKKNADVIVHMEEYEYQVDDIDDATLKVHKVYTVLNEDGRDALTFYESTSKYKTLSDPEIRVLDASGKQISRYKKKDMTTVATGEGLIDDGYVTYYTVSAVNYPVTIELNYELQFKNTVNVPAFYFIQNRHGVVESKYTARIPSSMHLRYKARNTTIEPAITDDGKMKQYKWTVNNIAPITGEPGSSAGRSRVPHVELTLDKFAYYGIPGDMSSWKAFGAWLNELYKGLDELPADRQQFFNTMVKDAKNDREKIRLIYQYLQQNFRYVSIQLGVGGFKPFSASFTDQKKYGDCKALSNYMKAALRTVGINSHLAIINAQYNEEPVDPDFPANGFNHVVLCVPMKSDSVWLECTSSTNEFAELGTFTENRNALLLTENGGVLTPTPASRASANQLGSITRIKLDTDLSGETETIFTARGAFSEVINSVSKENKDDQKRAIVSYFGYKQPDAFEFKKSATDAKSATLRMIIQKIPEFTSGTKWFLAPRIHKLWSSKLPKSENRKLDFYFRFPFEQVDTTIIQLPAGVVADGLVANKELSCSYANYSSSSWYNNTEHAIYSASRLLLKKHKVLAKDYQEVQTFFDSILKEESQKFVLNVENMQKKAF